MNAYVIVVLAAVASAQAGLLGAPVAYAGLGQVSSQAGAFTTSSQSLRVSQSARPVAYAAAPAVHYAAARAVHYAAAPAVHYAAAPAVQYAAAPAVHYAAAPAVQYAAAPAIRYAGVGQVSSQAGALTTSSQSLRVSQSARPVAYAAAPAVHYAAAAPAVHYAAAPAVATLGSHIAYGYTPLATSLLH